MGRTLTKVSKDDRRDICRTQQGLSPQYRVCSGVGGMNTNQVLRKLGFHMSGPLRDWEASTGSGRHLVLGLRPCTIPTSFESSDTVYC